MCSNSSAWRTTVGAMSCGTATRVRSRSRSIYLVTSSAGCANERRKPMAHTIEDLRNHLFGTLASLRDTAAPMETERGRAIAEVARVIVDSAKVEVQHLA